MSERPIDLVDYIQSKRGLSYGLWSTMVDDMEPEVATRARKRAQRRDQDVEAPAKEE